MKTVETSLKKSSKITKSKSTLVKVSFHLKYKTHFGQGIYIYGNHPQLGEGKIENAVPLVYLNNDYWVLHLDIDTSTENNKIVYHYFIQNADGTKSFEAGNDKTIDFK